MCVPVFVYSYIIMMYTVVPHDEYLLEKVSVLFGQFSNYTENKLKDLLYVFCTQTSVLQVH